MTINEALIAVEELYKQAVKYPDVVYDPVEWALNKVWLEARGRKGKWLEFYTYHADSGDQILWECSICGHVADVRTEVCGCCRSSMESSSTQSDERLD